LEKEQHKIKNVVPLEKEQQKHTNAIALEKERQKSKMLFLWKRNSKTHKNKEKGPNYNKMTADPMEFALFEKGIAGRKCCSFEKKEQRNINSKICRKNDSKEKRTYVQIIKRNEFLNELQVRKTSLPPPESPYQSLGVAASRRTLE